MKRPKPIPVYDCRWLIQCDLRAVVGIEKLCVDDPWTEKDFLKALRNCAALVAEQVHADDQENVVGFVVYGFTPRSLQIINMGVHPEHRRRGVGKKLIARLRGKLGGMGTKVGEPQRTRLTADVCERNLNMQLFLKSQGFKAERVIRDYANDGTNDAAYRMVFR